MTHEFRKLMNLFENDNPDVEYEYVGTTKSKTLSGDFDKVIAKLSGPTSAKFTKIGNKFKELAELEKEITKLKAESRKQANELMTELFDSEEDAVLTRIAETKSIVMQFAKDTPPKEVEQKYFDVYGFVRQVENILGRDLYWALRDIRLAHEKVRTITKAGKKGALTIKKADQKKSVKEDVGMEQVDKIADVVGQLTDTRMDIVDRKLDNLKSAYGLN